MVLHRFLADFLRLVSLVDLWDPLKQQAAYEGFVYYVHHVEKNDALKRRVAEFTARLETEARTSEPEKPTDDKPTDEEPVDEEPSSEES